MASELWKFKRTIGMGYILISLIAVVCIMIYKGFETEEDKSSTPTLLKIDANETIIEACTCKSLLNEMSSDQKQIVVEKDEMQMELKFKLFSWNKNGTAILVLSGNGSSTELFKVHIGFSKIKTEVHLVQNGSIVADGNSSIGNCHSDKNWREFILKISIAEGTLILLDQDILILEAKIGKFMARKIKFYNFLYTTSDEEDFDILQIATECTQYNSICKERLPDLVTLNEIQNCLYNKINKKFFCRP